MALEESPMPAVTEAVPRTVELPVGSSLAVQVGGNGVEMAAASSSAPTHRVISRDDMALLPLGI
jgi:hypothetical protein